MRIFLELLMMLGVLLVAAFVVTQMVIPTITGEPFFPLFRRSGTKKEIKKVESELQSVSEQEILKDLTTEVQRRKAQLEQK